MSARGKETVAAIEILIAEDSSTQAERLRHLLEQHHYHVTVVEAGLLARTEPAVSDHHRHQYAAVERLRSVPTNKGR